MASSVRHEPPRIVGDLLSAEIAEKRARSIKYQLTIAKLPLAKDIDEFVFASRVGPSSLHWGDTRPRFDGGKGRTAGRVMRSSVGYRTIRASRWSPPIFPATPAMNAPISIEKPMQTARFRVALRAASAA